MARFVRDDTQTERSGPFGPTSLNAARTAAELPVRQSSDRRLYANRSRGSLPSLTESADFSRKFTRLDLALGKPYKKAQLRVMTEP